MVDGREIRRSPVDMSNVYAIIYGILYISGGAGLQPSTVGMMDEDG